MKKYDGRTCDGYSGKERRTAELDVKEHLAEASGMKANGVLLRCLCRGCARVGQVVDAESLALFDDDMTCIVCGGDAVFVFDPEFPPNRDVIPRAFTVYFERLNEAITTATKGLRA